MSGFSNPAYSPMNILAGNAGASYVGTASGDDLQTVLDTLTSGAREIWADNFGAIVDNTDCCAVINAAMASAGTDKKVIRVPYVGTILVSSVSVTIPRNTWIDWGGNKLRLANNANKYMFTQSDLVTDTFVVGYGNGGGFISMTNYEMDGNATFQTRNLVGTDARDMYCGFGGLFFGLDVLYLSNYKITDTNAWGIAHFKCRRVYSYDFECAQDPTRIGLNGDGVTGISAAVFIKNGFGYTNDDFCAVGTTRASMGGTQIWNDGVDVEIFDVDGLDLRESSGTYTHFACGVYPSDGNTIKKWSMRNISGRCKNGVWRAGNYFSGLGATNGTIETIEEDNIKSASETVGAGQRYIFKCSVQNLNAKNFINVNSVVTANNEFLRVSESTVNYINVHDGVYQQSYTPATREGMIYAYSSSTLKHVTIHDVTHSLTGAQDPTKFTFLRYTGPACTLTMSGLTRAELGGSSQLNTKDDYWVSTNGVYSGGLNIKFTDTGSALHADYTASETLRFTFNSDMCFVDGVVLSGTITATPNNLAFFTRPTWAKPVKTTLTKCGVFVKNGGGAGPYAANLVVKDSTTAMSLYHISGAANDCYYDVNMVYQVYGLIP